MEEARLRTHVFAPRSSRCLGKSVATPQLDSGPIPRWSATGGPVPANLCGNQRDADARFWKDGFKIKTSQLSASRAASSSSTVERQRRKPSSPYICRCDWRTGRTHRRFSSVSHRRATDALLISGARLRRSVNQPNPEVHLEPTELTSRELTLMKGLSELPEKPFSFFHG